jgi:hypothetical protein
MRASNTLAKEPNDASAKRKHPAERKEQLRSIAEGYFEALRKQNLAAIPYDDNVTLRAPLTPGGVSRPLTGKSALHSQ